ncbi:Oxidoreductase [Entamoeba marina]
MHSRKVKVCLCGTGRLGSFRAGLFLDSKDIELVAVVEPFKVCQTVLNHRNIRIFKSVDDINIPIDAIWISTPTSQHPQTIALASKKTKFIFCEKPIASTPRLVKESYDICKKNGAVLHCGWMRRRDVGYQSIKEYLVSNNVTIQRAEFHSFDWPIVPPEFLKTLGNIFVDLMCHDFNLVMYYMNNKLPKYVTAIGVDGGVGIWDSAVATLDYPNNISITITATRNGNKVYDNSLTVLTSNSQILECGKEPENLSQTFMERHDINFKKELPFFANMVRNNGKAGNELGCIYTSVLIQAATRSATLGGKKIPIAEPKL